MYYNDNSIRENKEFSSTIIYIKNSEGKVGFTYTLANIGDDGHVSIIKEPFSKLAATIHSHAAYSEDPDMENNNFTGMKNKNGSSSAKIRQESRTGDIGNANERGIPSYVATPSGSLKRYDPQSEK